MEEARTGQRRGRLYAVAVRAQSSEYWLLYPRLHATREAAERWSREASGGTGCQTAVLELSEAAEP